MFVGFASEERQRTRLTSVLQQSSPQSIETCTWRRKLLEIGLSSRSRPTGLRVQTIQHFLQQLLAVVLATAGER